MALGRLHNFTATGVANMGDVTDRGSICRFGLPVPFLPTRFHGHVSGGSGSATLSLLLDHNDLDSDAFHNFLYADWASFGTGGKTDVFWRVLDDELAGFVSTPPQEIVAKWTNPASGTMRWEIMLTLAEWI